MERDVSRDGPPSRRLRYVLAAVALVTLASAAVGVRAAVTSPQRMQSGRAAVRAGDVDPSGMYVSADTLSAGGSTRLPDGGSGTRTRALAAPALAPLSGGQDPVATPSPDGQSVAYETWRWKADYDWFQPLEDQGVQNGDTLGSPAIHILDLSTGADRALEYGSFSPAWRADGALAYVHRGKSYSWNVRYVRDVVVRAPATAAPVTWSTAHDLYRVEGWAGSHLIVSREVEGGPGELDVYDGPGQSRVLATEGTLLAISPDGTEALVADPASAPDPSVRLVRVSDSTVAAVLPLASVVDPVLGTPLAWVGGSADWEGDHVAVSAETGLVVLTVVGDAIRVEQVLHLDAATAPNGMLYEPRFTDAGRSIVVWEDVSTPLGKPWSSAQLVCDRTQLSCVQSAPVAPTHQPRPVYDRSAG